MEYSLLLYFPLSWAFNNTYLSFGLIASFFLFRIVFFKNQNKVSKLGDFLLICASFIYIFIYSSLPLDEGRYSDLKSISCVSDNYDLHILVDALPLKNDNNITFTDWADIKYQESLCLQENKHKKDN